jgi:hypothetical protein
MVWGSLGCMARTGEGTNLEFTHFDQNAKYFLLMTNHDKMDTGTAGQKYEKLYGAQRRPPTQIRTG